MSVFFLHMVVVVTKFISSRDTRWPASKSYYAGSSTEDATNLYRAPSNPIFSLQILRQNLSILIKHTKSQDSFVNQELNCSYDSACDICS